tara:strand:+ start:808 stop:1128 length:321 start_codon:yes stop_codon:yes gene_type:complete
MFLKELPIRLDNCISRSGDGSPRYLGVQKAWRELFRTKEPLPDFRIWFSPKVVMEHDDEHYGYIVAIFEATHAYFLGMAHDNNYPDSYYLAARQALQEWKDKGCPA